MAAVRLPDGKELEIKPGERARDVVKRIGPRLARDAVVAKLDGRLVDLDTPLDGGGQFEVVTTDSAEGLAVLRHSTAHAMAQAILELYPGSKLTIGPPIEDGFFYDIEVAGRITDEDLPRITERWKTKRILLFAPGGLIPEKTAAGRLSEYRSTLLEAEVYPLAFVWRSDFWTTLTNILRDALGRTRPEGPLDASLDFMLDRLDDALEPLARRVGGRSQWNEMKQCPELATIGDPLLDLGHLLATWPKNRASRTAAVGVAARLQRRPGHLTQDQHRPVGVVGQSQHRRRPDPA
jgi:hypothetical protein